MDCSSSGCKVSQSLNCSGPAFIPEDPDPRGRPMDVAPSLVSPCRGTLHQSGALQTLNSRFFQSRAICSPTICYFTTRSQECVFALSCSCKRFWWFASCTEGQSLQVHQTKHWNRRTMQRKAVSSHPTFRGTLLFGSAGSSMMHRPVTCVTPHVSSV